tara:strand:+ start:874 stop:1812 length:939 start_codon:yes stop_codon:yes gene_type:complete
MDFNKMFNRGYQGLNSIAEGLTRPEGGGVAGVADSLIQRLHGNLPKKGENIRTKASTLIDPIIDDSDPEDDNILGGNPVPSAYNEIADTVSEFVPQGDTSVVQDQEELEEKTWDIQSSNGRTFTVTQNDLDVLARTIAAEARSESVLGQAAVAHVALNRLVSQHGGEENLTDILLDAEQFSAWNVSQDYTDMKNVYVNKNDPDYENARNISIAVLDGRITDPTYGSNHYYANKGKYKLTSPPYWYNEELKRAKTNRFQIGNHLFTGRAVSWNTTYNSYDYRKQFDTYKVIPTKRSQALRWAELNSMDVYDER